MQVSFLSAPVSMIPNLRAISAPGDPEWLPRNADNREPEELPIRAALIESNNAAAASLQPQAPVQGIKTGRESDGEEARGGPPPVANATAYTGPQPARWK